MHEFASHLKKYHRLSNYLATSMLYLRENYFLEKDLQPEHIKKRILGHWGTVPGLNALYGALNILIQEKIVRAGRNEKITFIAGPGHGAPAVIAGQYVEESLATIFTDMNHTKSGWASVIKQFSWPGGLPSHTYPGLPGQIHEGGELGYSLATAFGSVFDAPQRIAVAVIGDGEAETGPLAASWQSNKFLNHSEDGIVLPVLHLNGYKISGPTLFSTMTDTEITHYFQGLGYAPQIVDYYQEKENVYATLLSTLENIWELLLTYKEHGGALPILIFKTMKGWTGVPFISNPLNHTIDRIEDNNLSHGIPLEHPASRDTELSALSDWLISYDIGSLVSVGDHEALTFDEDIQDTIPPLAYTMGMEPKLDGSFSPPLKLPRISDYALQLRERGTRKASRTDELADFLRDVFRENRAAKNFRLFSPDESESNKLHTIFHETSRMLNRPVRPWDDFYADNGRIMELLSEHVLQSWYEGYVKTGRHGLLISYEAFLPIITSQINQYIKYIQQSQRVGWRTPLPPMNYIATSTGWRQDHNGFSHQSPGLISNLLTQQAPFVSVYTPADTNVLLATLVDSLQRYDSVNLIVAGKRHLPEWLSIDEAKEHVSRGISLWPWASQHLDRDPDVVLVSAGDYQTHETLAAAELLQEHVPELAFHVVNVNEITMFGVGDEQKPVLTEKDIHHYFTEDKPVLFNFHGYPEVIKQVTWGTSLAHRTRIFGYREQGTTTTPFDMQVVNKASRYHMVIESILAAAEVNDTIAAKKEDLIAPFIALLNKHRTYIVEHGEDVPEVQDFTFTHIARSL